jgi:hypothetical protein
MAKKSKPKSTSIMGHAVNISFLPIDKMPEDLLGSFDYETHDIVVADVPEWEMILLHEIIHAIFYFSGHSEHLGDVEESIVMALEHGLKPHIKLCLAK